MNTQHFCGITTNSIKLNECNLYHHFILYNSENNKKEQIISFIKDNNFYYFPYLVSHTFALVPS